MKDSISDPRQQIILNAAWNAFAAYGYRKTSMDDIARGAAMSRPALYLHYRNKQDIFRTLAQYYYDQACPAVTTALAGPGSPGEVLAAAFAAQAGEVVEVMLNSPHGMELLDETTDSAADIVLAGEARLEAIYATWLAGLESSKQAQLPGTAQDVAGMLMAALKGIKKGGVDFATYQRRIHLLGSLVAAGIQRPG